MTKTHIRLSVLTLPFLMIGALQMTGCANREPDPPPPGGAYISTSGGANFDQSVKLVDDTGQHIGDVASHPLRSIHRTIANPATIYSAAGGGGLITSTDNGQTWRQLEQPLQAVTALVELEGGTLLASGTSEDNEGIVIRSLDQGRSWERVLTIPSFHQKKKQFFEIIKRPPPPPVFVSSIILNPFHVDLVYATTSTGDILVGEQFGKVWRSLSSIEASKKDLFTNRAIAPISKIIPSPHVDNEMLLITTDGELVKITPDEDIKLDIDNRDAVDATFIKDFPNAIFVGTKRGVIISRDNGQTWTTLSLPISTTEPLQNAVVRVSPTNPNRLLVAIDSIIYRSEDGGATWNALAIGLPNHIITDISIDPTNAARVLLITTPIQV